VTTDISTVSVELPTWEPQRRLSKAQRRALKTAQKVIGEAKDVRAYAAGRAQARMSDRAWWVAGIIAGMFLLALVLLRVVLVPGVIAWYIVYDAIRPRRGVAVTGEGITELKLSLFNGMPKSVIAELNHAALAERSATHEGGKVKVTLGHEVISLRKSEFEMLVGSVPPTGSPPLPPAPGNHLSSA
jgi:hypothetical protein